MFSRESSPGISFVNENKRKNIIKGITAAFPNWTSLNWTLNLCVRQSSGHKLIVCCSVSTADKTENGYITNVYSRTRAWQRLNNLAF